MKQVNASTLSLSLSFLLLLSDCIGKEPANFQSEAVHSSLNVFALRQFLSGKGIK
jgi:hypothetical protein